jgi:hypothetical protein
MAAPQASSEALILRDGDGNYYLFPAEVVAKARVPAERRAELEEALRQGDDTAGYGWFDDWFRSWWRPAPAAPWGGSFAGFTMPIGNNLVGNSGGALTGWR